MTTALLIISSVALFAYVNWILFFKKSAAEKDTKIHMLTPTDFKVSKTGVKKTFTVPVGNKSKEEAKESLVELISDYKEVADFSLPRTETVPKKKRQKKKVIVTDTEPAQVTVSPEVNKQANPESQKPKKKRGRKPKNKGGDNDQLILS